MKKHFSTLLGMLILLGGMTSCLDNIENDIIYYDYCTITGSMDSEYVIYSDTGDELHPNMTSVYDYTNGKGFGTARRALMQFTYKEKNIINRADGSAAIYGMEVKYGVEVTCSEPLSATKAAELGVTDKDSITDFSLGSIWMSNGFLNAYWEGYYSKDKNGYAIMPTLSLVYDEKTLNGDSLKFTIYYNRHDSVNAPNYYNSGEQVSSYDIVDLIESLPASDSIVLTVQKPEGIASNAKFARKDIKHPY